MKREAWQDLIYLFNHAEPEEWRAAIDAIREARGTSLLAQALCPDYLVPIEKITHECGRLWLFMDVQSIPRYI